MFYVVTVSRTFSMMVKIRDKSASFTQNRIQNCECFDSRNNSKSTNHIYCSPNSLYIHKNLYREIFNVYYTLSWLDPVFLTHIHTHTEWEAARRNEKDGERI